MDSVSGRPELDRTVEHLEFSRPSPTFWNLGTAKIRVRNDRSADMTAGVTGSMPENALGRVRHREGRASTSPP